MHFRSASLALALVLVSTGAAAQQPSDADKAAARALAQQAQDALDHSDFTTAADRFARARQLFPAPTLALGLGRAQVGLGHLVAAQETFNRILRDGAPAGSPPAYAKAVADAHRDLDALEPRIPNLIVVVQGVAAASARVTLDGTPMSNALLGVARPIDPGRHVVHAEVDGFAPADATVTVPEHKTESVTLTLDHPVAGGAHTGGTAAPPPPPPPGPGTPPPPPPPPADSGGGLRRTIGFAALGVGGAGLIMGAVTGGLALSKSKTLSDACADKACPASQQSNVDSYHLMANLSTAGFVAGGVLAAAGVVLVVTAPKSSAPAKMGGTPKPPVRGWVAPVIGPAFAGLQGRFQ